jgi:phosphoenolpyruvate synthase/pyruvate phosphate dikinase
MPSFICSFPSNESPTLSDVGGKGYSLLQMSRFMPVPPGLLLTTAFFDAWWQEIFRTDEWKEFLTLKDKIPAPVASGLKSHAMLLSFTDQQNDSLAEAMEHFDGNQLFAVRSSSPEEDLEGSSFAGAYETVLGVTRKNIQAAVRTCFASCLDYRIVTYKREHGFDIHSPKIAVVIQKQIASDQSGVAFSLNPVTNDFDEAVINANYGLGETVVSGDVTPDAFVVNKVENRIVFKQIGKKEAAIWLVPNGGTRRETRKDAHEYCITENQVLEVTRLVKSVEARNGKPMDIEWAYEAGKLYLLQARPVTAFQPLPPDLVSMPSQPRRLYLDVTRSVQGIEQPLSEMGASIIKLVFSRVSIAILGKDYSDHIESTIPYVTAGRAYANLSNALPFTSGQKLAENLAAMDPIVSRALLNIDIEKYKPVGNAFRLMALQALKRVPWLPGRFLAARTYPEAFRADAELDIEVFKQQLVFIRRSKTPLRKFAYNCFDLLLRLVFYRLGPILVTGLRAKDRISKLAGPKFSAEVEALTKALPGNVTVEMGLELFAISKLLPAGITAKELAQQLNSGELPAVIEAWDKFLIKYGHRAPQEFDIATKRFREDSTFLVKQILSLSKLQEADKNPETHYKQAVQKRHEAHEVLSRAFAKKNRMSEIRFDSSYRVMTSFLGMRETPKFCLMLAMDAIRQRIEDAGNTLVARGVLANVDQVWEISFDQLCSALEGTPIDLKTAIIANRARRARLKLATMPKIFDSRGRIIRAPALAAKENEIAGTAISAGVVTGIARVLRRPDEKSLKAGDILVARATDPGWTPLFATASAVVLEVGGMLQHGALVAREYGLPCVSGIDNVTELIKDGSTIEVDGTNGIVRLIKP